MIILVAIMVLWGSTLGIIAADKSMRAGRPRPIDDVPSFTEEPAWGTLAALCILLNFAALPYYFYATRRSALWGLIGFFAFVGCVVLMILVQIVCRLAGLR